MLDRTTAATKKPDAVDVHVGSRVRMRRMQMGKSQEWLGDELGLTFQQVQKYEKGANRMGASRLVAIASALSCPVMFFFEGLPGNSASISADDRERMTQANQFLSTTQGVAIAYNFPRIPTPAAQQTVVELIAHLARPR